MTNDRDGIAESIKCGFKIIQSPDREHLRITVEPVNHSNHLDNYMLSLNLYPNLSVEKAEELENMLNDCVQALWVNILKKRLA